MSDKATINNIKPGDFVTVHLYSDAYAYTVVRITKKFVEVRQAKQERDPSWKPEIVPGGFAGHCTNNYSQKWIVTENPDAPIGKLSVGRDGTLRGLGSRRPNVTVGAHPFYDYNF